MSVHTFTLTASLGTDAATAEVWQQLKAAPPAGCTYVPEVYSQTPGLRCEREASTRLEAVFGVVGEVHASHGLLLDDLGVEKLSEWICDGIGQPDGPTGTYAADIAAQALLLAIDRLRRLGHGADGIKAFTDLALGRPLTT
ncbi:amidase [Kitasatospora sp. NPDC056446]|uniref:amidase n=1 Tax=Kitasatospora sp. NPDC056446 TaxID=3345819 RepID=UPI003690C5A2